MTFNNEIARLQKCLEIAESNASKLALEVEGSLDISKEKTNDMGMIFMAVANLLQRSTSKFHHLMHYETKLSKDAMSSHGGKDEEEVGKGGKKGKKIMNELDIISAYIIDLMDIVDQCPDEKRDME